MAKEINIYKNKSYSELDWTPGELIAFDNTDLEYPSPLILAIPKKIVKGFEDSSKGMNLLYHPQDGEDEKWTLYYQGNMLCLWSPNYKKGLDVPNFKSFKKGSPRRYGYFVESALAGREAVQKYLQGSNFNLDFYARCLESEKLITERSQLGKLVQKIGFGFVLPDQLRFRN